MELPLTVRCLNGFCHPSHPSYSSFPPIKSTPACCSGLPVTLTQAIFFLSIWHAPKWPRGVASGVGQPTLGTNHKGVPHVPPSLCVSTWKSFSPLRATGSLPPVAWGHVHMTPEGRVQKALLLYSAEAPSPSDPHIQFLSPICMHCHCSQAKLLQQLKCQRN